MYQSPSVFDVGVEQFPSQDCKRDSARLCKPVFGTFKIALWFLAVDDSLSMYRPGPISSTARNHKAILKVGKLIRGPKWGKEGH